MNYEMSKEVEDIVDELLSDVEDFEILNEKVNVRAVMTNEARKKNGVEVCGRAVIVSGLPAVLILDAKVPGYDPMKYFPQDVFVVEVAYPFWQLMDEDQRHGCVDHLLSHFAFDDEKQTFRVTPPEFGEFPGTLARHGFWRPDDRLQQFAERAKEQLALFEGVPA